MVNCSQRKKNLYMDEISLIDISSDDENSVIDVSLEDVGCLISSCSEKENLYMGELSLIDISSDDENSLIDVSLEDGGCLISSCSEKKNLEMYHRIPLIDVSSDSDNCLIDVALEDCDCLISSRSGFACKSRKKEKIAPSSDVSRSTRCTRVAGKKNESQVAPTSVAAVSHSKRRRVTGKKKENELALLPAAAADPNNSKDANRKKGPITVNKKIPQGTISMLLPIMFGKTARYKMHSYLTGKKVILYGLPGYLAKAIARKYDPCHARARFQIWNAFRLDRVVKPAEEFIKQVECLIGECVDEVLFFTVNWNVLRSGLKNQTTREKFEVFKFVADVYAYHPKSYYSALGLEIDMQEDNIPPRSRRFMLLVDNLRVKYVNIESSDGHFVVPSAEEISKAFQQ